MGEDRAMLDHGTGTVGKIDRSSPLPLYHQLKQILLSCIKDEEIFPGEALPSETELQKTYGVSRITVRRALGDLAAEGYVTREPGRGTFVLRPKAQDDRSAALGGLMDSLRAQGFEVDTEILQYEMRVAPPRVARKLGVDEGLPLLRFLRLIYADGTPIVLVTVHTNPGDAEPCTREELSSDSLFVVLERKHGIVVRRADRTIEATKARDEEARLLGIVGNPPMLLHETVVFDEQEQPVAHIKAVCRGDRYKFHTTTAR
jgi:GntR family transcriptional regulator